MTDTDPTPARLTISAAARAAGVDQRTIRRHLNAGHFPGAARNDGSSGPGTGPWSIPSTDLLAAGLVLRTKTGEDPEPQPEPVDRSEVAQLRERLTDAIKRAEIAEARAEERERVIEAQQLAIRSLTAGTDDPSMKSLTSPDLSTPTSANAQNTGGAIERARRWWRM